jgi:hypothetical protein
LPRGASVLRGTGTPALLRRTPSSSSPAGRREASFPRGPAREVLVSSGALEPASRLTPGRGPRARREAE